METSCTLEDALNALDNDDDDDDDGDDDDGDDDDDDDDDAGVACVSPRPQGVVALGVRVSHHVPMMMMMMMMMMKKKDSCERNDSPKKSSFRKIQNATFHP